MTISNKANDLKYSVWKTVVQAQSLPVYHKEVAPEKVEIFAGTVDSIVRSNAVGADYTDWDSTFSSGSTVVSDDEEAFVKILLATGTAGSFGERRDPATGALVVSVVGGGNQTPRIEKWAADNEPIDTSWETLWSKSESGIFYKSMFHLNSDDISIRVSSDGTQLFEIDLNELHGDFGLDFSGNKPFFWDLQEYNSKQWAYNPPAGVSFVSSFTIEFKANSGNKKVVRGMSSWSPV